ncbi:MAG TPA: FMN-binding protein [Holophaga sp.]|nr:FMN-binding protein [Holophaga sp.]
MKALAALVLTVPLAALPTPQEALALAFPGATFTRRERVLTEGEARRVQELAGTPPRTLQVSFEAMREGRRVGLAFLDTHRVRTLDETVLVAVGPDGRILRTELVAFHEPQEYQAREAWLRQFQGRRLDGDLALKRGVRPLSGATLTAQALLDASRRALALAQVMYP